MSRGLVNRVLRKLEEYASSDSCGVGYVKHPNGTMICYGSFSSVNVWSNQIGFAQTFIDTPKVIPSVIANVSTPIGFTALTVTATNFTLSYSTPSGSKTIEWIAIGKWK